MAKEHFVLIHPSEKGFDPALHAIWEEWIQKGARVLRGSDDTGKTVQELEDNTYVDLLDLGTAIVLGGQRRDWCMCIHLMSLLNHPSILNRERKVEVSVAASRGGSLTNMELEAARKGINLVKRF